MHVQPDSGRSDAGAFGKIPDRNGLVVSELEHEESVVGQDAIQPVDDGSDGVESVGSASQRHGRLVLAHTLVERLPGGIGDVGWIRHDQIESRLGPPFEQRPAPVTVDELDPIGDTMSFRVATGDFQSYTYSLRSVGTGSLWDVPALSTTPR